MKTKRIGFYNGLLSFKIPYNWIEEYNHEELSGTFYEDKPGSSTFRLYLVLAKPPQPIDLNDIEKIIYDLDLPDGPIVKLPNNNAYKKYVEKTEESGKDITIHYWSLVNINKPHSIRIANFSYTILSELEDKIWVRNEVEFLNDQIEFAIFQE